jgi:hypothetical protein
MGIDGWDVRLDGGFVDCPFGFEGPACWEVGSVGRVRLRGGGGAGGSSKSKMINRQSAVMVSLFTD